MSPYLQSLVARALGGQAAIRPPRLPRLVQPDGPPLEEAATQVARAPPPPATPWAETRRADAEPRSAPAPAPGPARSEVAATGPMHDAEDPFARAEGPAPVENRADRASPAPASWPEPLADRREPDDWPAPAAPPTDQPSEAAPVRVMVHETVRRTETVLSSRPRVEREQPSAVATPASDPAPDTYIHIGRVELHAAPPAVTVRRSEPRPTHQHMSLEEYLRRRDGKPQ